VGGIRHHSSKGVAEERRGGGSRSGRRAGVGSVRGSPYSERLWGLLVGAANEVYNRQNECKTLNFGGGIWRLVAVAARETENKLNSGSWKGG